MLSSIAILAVLFAACKCGVHGVVFLIVALGAATQVEFYGLVKKMGQRPLVTIGVAGGILLMLATYFSQQTASGGGENFILAPNLGSHLALVISAIISIVLLSRSMELVKRSVISTAVGIVYIPFMCCFPIAFLAKNSAGSSEIAMVFCAATVAKACDIGGMFAGKYFGRRKLAPDFSPNKTVEGVIGGILCSNIIGHIAFVYPAAQLYWARNTLVAACYSTLLALVASVGDLAESAIKRLANRKDSGNILPGIGGIFDLTDSLLFALPVHIIVLSLAPNWFSIWK
jgi:phosphatidate cytidylyltransferase